MERPAAKPARSPLPDLGDLLFMGILSLMLWLSPNLLFGDGSTGWHLVTGNYILDNHAIPHKDLISYTFPDRAWVPYEWLWDVAAAGLVRLGQLNLLAVACATLIAGLFSSLYLDMRKRGLHFALAAVLTIVGSLVATIHWLARPHLVTFLAVYIFNTTLAKFTRAECSSKVMLLTLALTMVVWANCHPAFLLGFALVTIYMVAEFFMALISPNTRVQHKAYGMQLLLALGLITAASLINPYGLGLFTYISHYLQQTSILEVTDEFNSPIFHGAIYAIALELLFFTLAIGLATSAKRTRLGPLLVVLAFGHLALGAKRNDPLFAIVALPLIGELLATSSLTVLNGAKSNAEPAEIESNASTDISTDSTVKPTRLLSLKNWWRELGANVDDVERSCNMHLLPILAVSLISVTCIAQGRISGIPALVDCGFDPLTKPTTTLVFLKAQQLDTKPGFSMDNWGGYIRYKTGNRVFIDDRSDFYGQDFFQHYGRIVELRSGWEKALDDNKFEWLLLPKNTSLAIALLNLEKTPQSKFSKVAEDPGAYVFRRKQQP